LNNKDRILPYGDPVPSDYEVLSREEIKAHLSTYIADLIEHNFEKLCNLVYRHDVSEHKFHQALQCDSVNQQAENVAELVIERELQKVETRKAYRKYKEGKKNELEK
jgi:hypothetical protein